MLCIVESHFTRNIFTRIRVCSVRDEKINQALEEDLRPYKEMYSELKQKESQSPLTVFFERKRQDASAAFSRPWVTGSCILLLLS
jgi:hypothetical protein